MRSNSGSAGMRRDRWTYMILLILAATMLYYGCGSDGGGAIGREGPMLLTADRKGNLSAMTTDGKHTPFLDVYNAVDGSDIGPFGSMVYDPDTGYIYIGTGGWSSCKGCIFKVNPTTGAAYEVLDMGWQAIPGMSIWNGEIYMVNNWDINLLKVTPTAGTAPLSPPTIVGAIDPSFFWGNGMTFDSSGNLWLGSSFLDNIDSTDGSIIQRKPLIFEKIQEHVDDDPDFIASVYNNLRLISLATHPTSNETYGILKNDYDNSSKLLELVSVKLDSGYIGHIGGSHSRIMEGLFFAPAGAVKSNFAIRAPQAPTIVEAVGGYNASIIGWDAVFGADSYTVYWSTATGVNSTSYDGMATVEDTIYSHVGTLGTPYFYVITAYREGLESVESPEVSATPGTLGAEVITYSPTTEALTNSVSLGYEENAVLDLGFSFTYFGNSYTQVELCANGWLTFDIAVSPCSEIPSLMPSTVGPENVIAFAWAHLNPALGGTITYDTVGVAPDRKFIINYDGVSRRYFNGYYGKADVTTQVILYETGNLVEVHTKHMHLRGYKITQGVENSAGSVAYYLPLRVSYDFALTNDGVRFHTN